MQSGAANVSRDQADTSEVTKNKIQRRARKKANKSLAQGKRRARQILEMIPSILAYHACLHCRFVSADTSKQIGDTSALYGKNSSASVTASSSILPQSLKNYKATDRTHAQAPPVVQSSRQPLPPSNKRKRSSDSEERPSVQNGLAAGGNTSLQISGNGNAAALDSNRAKKKRKKVKASNVAADISAQGLSGPPQAGAQAMKPVVATIAQNGSQEVKASVQSKVRSLKRNIPCEIC